MQISTAEGGRVVCSGRIEGKVNGKRNRRRRGGEMEERKRHEIRNARYKLSREWNEINTSISAVTAAGVNKGLIEPEFAANLACFELLDPKNRICALPFSPLFRRLARRDRPTTPSPPPSFLRDAGGPARYQAISTEFFSYSLQPYFV